MRGLDKEAGDRFRRLVGEAFYRKLVDNQHVVRSWSLDASDALAEEVLADGWHDVIEHEQIPFVSYSYEWSFSMLKDAALLQLHIIEQAMEHGWTLKDASSFNLQWRGSRPVFIDVGSFEPWVEGEPWVGYRQFCSMFLIPLMLKAHLGFDPSSMLRSQLDGIPPLQAARLFRGRNRFKRGVLSHVTLPSAVEAGIARKDRDNVPARARSGGRHSQGMILGLVQGLKGLVRRLESDIQHTDWSRYAQAHSYADADFSAKKAFVTGHVGQSHRKCVWDIGCNTGTFSQLAAQHSDYVVAIDGDADAIEQLYLLEKQSGGEKILPLVVNLANISPNHGWGGTERKALDNRGMPDLVLCLALIHHMRVAANVPIALFLSWLGSLKADVVVEFVDRHDEMFEKLLVNRTVKYPDYTLEEFERAAISMFDIRDRQKIKGGRRELFFLTPK